MEGARCPAPACGRPGGKGGSKVTQGGRGREGPDAPGAAVRGARRALRQTQSLSRAPDLRTFFLLEGPNRNGCLLQRPRPAQRRWAGGWRGGLCRGWLRLRGERCSEPVLVLLCPKKLSHPLSHAPSPLPASGSGCGDERWGGQREAESKACSPAGFVRGLSRNFNPPAGRSLPRVTPLPVPPAGAPRRPCSPAAGGHSDLLRPLHSAARA